VDLGQGLTIDALRDDAARFRRVSRLPAAVLRVLPVIRDGNSLVAVPHLLYPSPVICARMRLSFAPRQPLAGAPFLPALGTHRQMRGDAGTGAAPYVVSHDADGSRFR
jgi:hypothetical protein